MKDYRCPEIGSLSHELRLSPMRHRIRQVLGAARAIDLIEAEREYPYSFVCFTITGYRPRHTEETLLAGQDVIADLISLIDELTAATPLPADWAEGGLYDADALATRFNVSKKTITRWRARGLIGCWYAFEDGKSRLAFAESNIQRFVAKNLELVRRGSAFQLMRTDEKDRIILRARELVVTEGLSLHAVTLRVAEETGRAVETIRYTLRRYDEENPAQALFDNDGHNRPVDGDQALVEAHNAGASLPELAERFNRREAEIRRVLVRARARSLAETPVAYIHNETFDAPNAATAILGDEPAHVPADEETPDELMLRVPDSVPAYLRELYRTPLLGRVEEATLFRRMNFLRHQAEQVRRRIAADVDDPKAEDFTELDRLLEAAGVLQNRIIQSNLRLVVSIAKRHLRPGRTNDLFELVSDGNMALMRAVDKFDYARGFRFSTYASWAITRHFARSLPEEYQQSDRFQTGTEEVLAVARDHRDVADTEEAARKQRAAAVAGVLRLLDARERSVVERHFGLDGGDAGRTLEDIGRELGISKERARQIEQRALKKLRDALGDRGVDLLAG